MTIKSAMPIRHTDIYLNGAILYFMRQYFYPKSNRRGNNRLFFYQFIYIYVSFCSQNGITFEFALKSIADDSIDVTNDEEPEHETEAEPHSPPGLLPMASFVPPYAQTQETVYETSARLLFMAVKWAKNLPSFASLAFRDQVCDASHTKHTATFLYFQYLYALFIHRQVILLEESWSELFLLNAIQWCMPIDASSCALFSVNEHCNSLNGTGVTKQEISADIRVLHDTLCRFKAVLVDPAEFACLKAVVLFRSETRGLKEPAQIENLQDQAQVGLKNLDSFEFEIKSIFILLFLLQVMLAQHCRGQFPAQIARFGRLLLMLPLLRTITSHKIESIFFQRTIGNTPMEKVLCDMYKN